MNDAFLGLIFAVGGVILWLSGVMAGIYLYPLIHGSIERTD